SSVTSFQSTSTTRFACSGLTLRLGVRRGGGGTARTLLGLTLLYGMSLPRSRKESRRSGNGANARPIRNDHRVVREPRPSEISGGHHVRADALVAPSVRPRDP